MHGCMHAWMWVHGSQEIVWLLLKHAVHAVAPSQLFILTAILSFYEVMIEQLVRPLQSDSR